MIERPRLPRQIADAIVPVLAGWLDAPGPERLVADTAHWTPREWHVAQRLITIHGLAAHLARNLPTGDAAGGIPREIATWLSEQHALNAQRIARMHDELATILTAAARAGIRVMPLKGALLTTLPGTDPSRRPMSDLDLLVPAADSAAMGRVMAGLGYSHRPEANPRPFPPAVFVGPEADRIVSIDEHPDNPRKVEIHTAVISHLWGWIVEDRLTESLWQHAADGEVLGSPAVIPAMADLFAHVAIHASADLFVGQGRLVQWRDLADLAPRLDVIPTEPHPRLMYPAVRLASRVMPGAIPAASFDRLEQSVPAAVVRWAEAVDLARQCGLAANSGTLRPWSLGERWSRWRPSRWRLAVAYGEPTLPASLARHGRVMAGAWHRRTTAASRRRDA